MKKNSDEAYISAIRAKYEEKKNGLARINPSPAQLRNVCIRIFNSNKDTSDLFWFNSFWTFEFKEDNIPLINENISKFKALGNFLKGKSIPPDWSSIEMAAILVELPERPFNKFKNLDLEQHNLSQNEGIQEQYLKAEEIQEIDSDTKSDDQELTNDEHRDTSNEKSTELSADILDQDKRDEETPTETEEVIDSPENNPTDSEYDDTKPIGFLTYPPTTTVRSIPPRPNKMYIIIGSILIMVVLVWGLNKTVFTPKNCMIWMEDHYEKIDCSDPEIQVYRIPLNDKLLEKFRKVAYSDTLTFFDPYGKPLIWYSKLNGQYELFTYHGLHPVTEKTLKPITHTIVNNITNNPNR